MSDEHEPTIHPSAGNVGRRAARTGDGPAALPPLSFPHGAEAGDELAFGPDLDHAAIGRLLGHLDGKRVLDLGCGDARTAIALAERGARVIAVDPSHELLAGAREVAEAREVKVELHQSDLAELAFVRAESVDAAYSAYALAAVDDLNRVFRQVHRVLKPEAPFLFSLPHPAGTLVDPRSNEPLWITRSYWDPGPLRWRAGGREGESHRHTISEVFTGLHRSSFRVDALLEPEPAPGGRRGPHWADAFTWLPSTLVVRARKEGS